MSALNVLLEIFYILDAYHLNRKTTPVKHWYARKTSIQLSHEQFVLIVFIPLQTICISLDMKNVWPMYLQVNWYISYYEISCWQFVIKIGIDIGHN